MEQYLHKILYQALLSNQSKHTNDNDADSNKQHSHSRGLNTLLLVQQSQPSDASLFSSTSAPNLQNINSAESNRNSFTPTTMTATPSFSATPLTNSSRQTATPPKSQPELVALQPAVTAKYVS
jgi:hypothetical protein